METIYEKNRLRNETYIPIRSVISNGLIYSTQIISVYIAIELQ